MHMKNLVLYQQEDEEETLWFFANEPLSYSVEVTGQCIVAVHVKQHELFMPVKPQSNRQTSTYLLLVWLSFEVKRYVVIETATQKELINQLLLTYEETRFSIAQPN